eukprot:CAMPEP_0181219938 /NCGR_PEP_ID=MMETSP1096-20121128/28564_1 /TAXON_ID=156174 ORGANISM="Chrysochromulina ericina, Strain CCMP281" /NCGR_SAMPLE_ID=MMETSP1096 /ASSEMBLY_ACC=CAM_ASM_000453 /LENGTH=234 /DNA_ID=CAMNT_0023312395 /DNA_START=53 /DNA_END=757 /DNA_ORIENTATION=+
MSKAALDVLKNVNYEVTQEALMSNVNEDLQKVAKEESANQLAAWEASRKHAQVEEDDDDFDDFDDDPVLQQLQQKRIEELKSRQAVEKQFHAQGHGEYREIVEEEFLKEVCGSKHVIVHFYHPEFFRCKVIDKHMRILAPKHLSCKFLTLNVEKAPFFVTKLSIQMLPTVIVFEDGIVNEQLVGLDDLGGKDDFRTEVLEHWFSKTGCIKISKVGLQKALKEDSESDAGDSDED